MSHQKLIKLLETYNTISANEREIIYKKFKFRKIKKREIIINKNSSFHKLFFVNSGILRAYYLNDQGREITKEIAWENRFIANICSFKMPEENHNIYECIKDAEILEISKDDFDQLLLSSNNLKCIYADILEYYNTFHIKRFDNIIATNIENKMKYLKNDFPNLINQVNDNILASFINVSREYYVKNKEFFY